MTVIKECPHCGEPTKILDDHLFPEKVECECEDKRKLKNERL